MGILMKEIDEDGIEFDGTGDRCKIGLEKCEHDGYLLMMDDDSIVLSLEQLLALKEFLADIEEEEEELVYLGDID